MNLIDLSGTWNLSLTQGDCPTELPRSVPMLVPGDNITALLNAGQIKDPAFARNELDLQWIGRCDWSISRSFTLDESPPEDLTWFFTADSLDTVARVAINGTTIAQSDNMFTRIRVEVPAGLLVTGTNTVQIDFSSAENEAMKRAEELPYPVPHSSYDVQSPNRNLVRKVQCHSGWDWGPCLMVNGVYGSIALEGTTKGLVEYAPVTVIRDGNQWQVSVTPVVRAAAGTDIPVTVRLLDPDGAPVAEAATVANDATQAGLVQSADPVVLDVPQPRLWWPAGEGDHPLYTVEISTPDHSLRSRVGLRTVEVRREPDEKGTGFAFVVNDRPVFARGANWIPQSALPGQADRDELADLLQSAVDANMNMIRVWGGGTYESDRFYDLCDELGLLIWQDFMFSCALYPSNPDFLESVRAEVTHQVQRLMHHPCIALWCGNNENVGALTWYEVSRENRDRYLVDYDRLNEGVIGTQVRRLDPGRLYWPSSPAAGPDDYSVNWTADASGDMHFWSVWHSGEPFASYRSVTPRFCSEFGFQSFPARDAVDSYTTPGQRNVTSPEMEHHQRHPAGNAVIMHTMARYYRFPQSLDEQLYLSQVQQAQAIRTAVEYWRSRKPECMGALYWQLNDTWPTASWSSIEYGGAWKLLHYAARRFFDQLLILAVPLDDAGKPLTPGDGPKEEGGPMAEEGEPDAWQVHVVNDLAHAVAGTAVLTLYDLDGGVMLKREEKVVAGAGLSVAAMKLDRDQLGAPSESIFAQLELDVDGEEKRTNWFFLTAPKRYTLQTPEITVTASAAEGLVEIRLETDRPAFHVALRLPGTSARFSDNNLCLMPGRPATVTVATTIDLAEIPRKLIITSLAEIGGEQ